MTPKQLITIFNGAAIECKKEETVSCSAIAFRDPEWDIKDNQTICESKVTKIWVRMHKPRGADPTEVWLSPSYIGKRDDCRNYQFRHNLLREAALCIKEQYL